MICDARHSRSIGLSIRLTMASDFRAAILLLLQRRCTLTARSRSPVDDPLAEKDSRLATRHRFSFSFLPLSSFSFLSRTSSSRLNACRFRHELLSCIGEAKKRQRKIRGEFVFSSERFRSSKRDDAGRENGSLTLQFRGSDVLSP